MSITSVMKMVKFLNNSLHSKGLITHFLLYLFDNCHNYMFCWKLYGHCSHLLWFLNSIENDLHLSSWLGHCSLVYNKAENKFWLWTEPLVFPKSCKHVYVLYKHIICWVLISVVILWNLFLANEIWNWKISQHFSSLKWIHQLLLFTDFPRRIIH